MAATIRENLLKFELRPMEIPRPKCVGMEFVQTIGRQGFYKTVRNEAQKYGVAIKEKGPRRPVLPDFWQNSQSSDSSAATTPSPTEMHYVGYKVDQNFNEVFVRRFSLNHSSTDSIPEEPEYPEPEPDYDVDDKPRSRIPDAPPLPPNFFKKPANALRSRKNTKTRFLALNSKNNSHFNFSDMSHRTKCRKVVDFPTKKRIPTKNATTWRKCPTLVVKVLIRPIHLINSHSTSNCSSESWIRRKFSASILDIPLAMSTASSSSDLSTESVECPEMGLEFLKHIDVRGMRRCVRMADKDFVGFLRSLGIVLDESLVHLRNPSVDVLYWLERDPIMKPKQAGSKEEST
uniref:Uncharacterized protein n=1 Tax=Bursaphelenchus xylophilus TaxID=6326 RepID=A0A1I7S0H0_BURXY